MLKVDPRLIRELSAGKQVVLVSATNGKSTTTRFIAQALGTLGGVAHNSTGANMAEGVVTALAEARGARFAALEVDEAHLPALERATQARTIVLMNLSRDQLDRGSEVKMLAKRWRAMLEDVGTPPGRGVSVAANADDPLVVWAAGDAADVTWVSCGQWWSEDSPLCPWCGHVLERDGSSWRCPSCGRAKPRATWGIDLAERAITTPDGSVIPTHLALPGRINVGNAAIAAAAVAPLGVDPAVAVQAFAQVSDVDGRYITTTVEGHPTRLLLGKNPASWTELIEMVNRSGAALVAVLNSRGADGRDPSWIWDVPFEALAPRAVWVAGERRYDMAVRLDTAGLDVQAVAAEPLDLLAQIPAGESVDIVANYTAFQDLRAAIVDAAAAGQPEAGS
jgi:UDP-N-acetylmuramyl tripeptide synthase